MKIFQLLGTLSKSELKILRKAALSPLYNTNQKVVNLFDILRPLHPNFNASLQGQQNVFKKLFPEEAYNESKLQWHFTKLTKVIEELLLYLAQENAPLKRQKRLTEIYRQRNIVPLFFRGTKKLLANLKTTTMPSAELHLQKYQVSNSQYFHPFHNKYDLKDTTLLQTIQNLDCFFALEKLRLTIALKSREQVLQEKHTYYFLEAIKKAPFAKNHPLLQLYSQALALSEDSTEVNFETFETTLFNSLATFELVDLQFLFFAGLNYAVKKRNVGIESFKKKLFEWYKFGLTSKLLFTDHKIDETTFANIIICACENKTFPWASAFIDNYENILIAEDLEVAIPYYRGLVYYISGDLDKSLDYLISCGKKSVFPPRKRAILIRALFEKYLVDKSYKNLLLSSLNSFNAVLRIDKKFSKERLNYYKNFIEIMRTLIKKIDKKETPHAIKQWLVEKSANQLPIFAKNWIFLKVDSL